MRTSFGVVHRVGPSRLRLFLQLVVLVVLSWVLVAGAALGSGLIIAYCRQAAR